MNISMILILINTIASGAGVSIVATSFPEFKFNYGISESILGILISFFPFFQISSLLIVHYLYKFITHKTLLIISTLFEGFSGFLYSLLNKMPNKNFVIFFGLIFRALHGFSCGTSNHTMCSLIPMISEKDEIYKNIGLFQAFVFIGTSLGPLISSICHSINGYSLPYYFISAIYIIIFLCLLLLNNPENENYNKDELFKIKTKEETEFYKNFANLDVLFHAIPTFLYLLCSTFYLPSLSLYLMKTFKISIEIASLFFMISSFVHIIGSLTINIINNFIGLKNLTFIGLILLSIGTILVYPINLIPNNIFYTIFGLFLIGLSSIGTILSSTLLIILSIGKHKKYLSKETIVAITSSIYNLNLPAAEMVGPSLGGYVSQYLGEAYMSIALGFIVIFYAVFYVIYYKGDFKEEKMSEVELLFNDTDYWKVDQDELENDPNENVDEVTDNTIVITDDENDDKEKEKEKE